MMAELKKVTEERDVALKSKRGLEEERDVAIATARSLEQNTLEWDAELEKYKTMSMGMVEKVKNAHREAISLFLKSPEYRQDITLQYFDGFEVMKNRVALAYPNLDFSQFEVDDDDGLSSLNGGRKEDDQADDAASFKKDTTIPSSSSVIPTSSASPRKTPEKVTPPIQKRAPIVTPPPGPTIDDGQAPDVSPLEKNTTGL